LRAAEGGIRVAAQCQLSAAGMVTRRSIPAGSALIEIKWDRRTIMRWFGLGRRRVHD
jgi:hypothetical protein